MHTHCRILGGMDINDINMRQIILTYDLYLCALCGAQKWLKWTKRTLQNAPQRFSMILQRILGYVASMLQLASAINQAGVLWNSQNGISVQIYHGWILTCDSSPLPDNWWFCSKFKIDGMLHSFGISAGSWLYRISCKNYFICSLYSHG